MGARLSNHSNHVNAAKAIAGLIVTRYSKLGRGELLESFLCSSELLLVLSEWRDHLELQVYLG